MATEEKILKKILIIEDEKPIARALHLALTEGGFAVQVVLNGEDALALLKTDVFDLILLDLVMPKFDGYQILEFLKETNKNIPVIVMTNLTREEDKKRVYEFGVKDFLVKAEVPIAAVVQRVKHLLGMQ